MPGGPSLIRLTRVAAAAGILLAVAGCGGSSGSPVAVSPPTPTPAAASRCKLLVAHLPGTVADSYGRRPTDPHSAYTAAWGDPPIILRCGVAAPGSPLIGSELTVRGVEWLVNENGASVQWLTLARPVTVELDVPATYHNQDAILSDVSAALPAVKRPASPSGS